MNKPDPKNKSYNNLLLLHNFVGYFTHVSHPSDGDDPYFKEPLTFTAEQVYAAADMYIEEDHVDGKENPEDHIITYGAESSFDHDDKDREYPEQVVIVADYGPEIGTRTVAVFSDIDNLVAVNDFLELIKNPYQGY